MAPPRSYTLLIALALAANGCGEPAGPLETASIETRSSGGDEVISEEGQTVGGHAGPGLAAPVATRDAYRDALDKAKARRETELRQVEASSPTGKRLQQELLAIDAKLRNVDLAFLEQRQAYVLAEGSLEAFVYQYAADREWEVDYALRAGDLGLAASIVQDVLARFAPSEPARVGHVEVPQEAPLIERDTPAQLEDMASDRLKAETAGATALLKLAQLSVEAADFSEAERVFRACLSFQSDLGAQSAGLNGYAALLELLGRTEEAERIDDIAARTLNLRR